MDDFENPNDPDALRVARRLQRFASEPLDAEVAARALGRVRAGRPASRRVSRTKLLSAAAVATFVASGVGLAAADVLPPTAQEVAHNALNAVGVHVPPGHERYNDATVCPGGPYANHGAYVRAHPDDPNAGKSPCGKPTRAVNPSGRGAENDKEKNAGNGPPDGVKSKKGRTKQNQGKDDQAENDENDTDDSPGGVGRPSDTVPNAPTSTPSSTASTTTSTSGPTTTTTSTTAPESTTTST
jgi:hypothetical protein